MSEDLPPIPKPAAGSAYLKLRMRLRRFVEAYVETGNASESMRRIGFAGTRPDVAGSKLLKKPTIRAAVDEYDLLASAQWRTRIFRTYREVDFLAHFDKRRLFDATGQLLPPSEWPDDVAAAVASVEIEELYAGRGEERRPIGRLVKVRTWPKNEALKMKLQIQKQLTNSHEVTGKDGVALPGTVVYVIARAEADQIGHALEAKV